MSSLTHRGDDRAGGTGAGRRETEGPGAGDARDEPVGHVRAEASSPPRGSRGSPGGRRREKREELRRLLLDAGVSLLREQGLRGGAEHVTLAAVFDRVEAATGQRITKGSVYERIWDSQRHYQLDVLGATLRTYAGREADVVASMAAEVVATADLSSAAGRRQLLGRLLQRAGDAYVEALVASREWHIWIGAWGLVASGAEDDPEFAALADAIADGYASANERFEELYRDLMALVGYRLRPGRTLHQFAVAAGALASGLAMRARYLDDAETRSARPIEPSGEVETWSLLATALEALVDAWAEPVDPIDDVPVTDPGTGPGSDATQP